MKFYCGVGSRETPDNILKDMKYLATILERQGYILRSGGAKGADTWFARGCSNAQIWLPWKGFNEWERNEKHEYKILDPNDNFASEMVDKFHPIGKELRGKTRLLMMRNTYQVIGVNEPNSQFVVCWTPNGEDVGGTRQAIVIAVHFQIPVYNMFHMEIDEIFREIEKLNLLQ